MNFEFKSTFINALRKQPFIYHNRAHFLWLILIFNSSTSIYILWLYLTNRFLPAVLGSYPHGNLYILLLKVIIALKVASSMYAAAFIAIKKLNKQNLLSQLFRSGMLGLSRLIMAKASWRIQRLAHLLNSETKAPPDSARNVEYNKHSIINKTN